MQAPTAIQSQVAAQFGATSAGKKESLSFNEFCNPREYKLQKSQIVPAQLMRPGTAMKELLIFHKIGAGKSCAMAQIAAQWTNETRPIFVVPASLVPNILAELRGPCMGDKYMTAAERSYLKQLLQTGGAVKSEMRRIIALCNERIAKDFLVLSYNRFVTAVRAGKLPPTKLLLVDECHNFLGGGKLFQTLHDFIKARPQMKIVIATATPIFDNPYSADALFMILRRNLSISEYLDDNGMLTRDRLRLQQLRNQCDGLVSYFAGAPAFTFPKTTIHYERLTMSPHQIAAVNAARALLSRGAVDDLKPTAAQSAVAESALDSFYGKSQMASLFAYPGGRSGTEGFGLLRANQLERGKIGKFSCKYEYMLKRFKSRANTPSGRAHILVIVKYKGIYGIKLIKKIMLANGYKNYAQSGPGPKTYAIWSGDETAAYKTELLEVFNSPKNDDTSQMQIVFGTSAMKEGVSYLRVTRMMILTSCWNNEQFEQFIGRASRYCSHKRLSAAQRVLDVYVPLACVSSHRQHQVDPATATPEELTAIRENSVDEYILTHCHIKKIRTAQIANILIDVAVDKYVYT